MKWMQALALILCASSMVFAQDFLNCVTTEEIHALDQKYAGKLDFMGSNVEMVENIGAAEAEWRDLMVKTLDYLTTHLPDTQKKRLLASQDAWEAALKADMALYYIDGVNLRLIVGREGEICIQHEFMRRVRGRALQLIYYCDMFLSAADAKPSPIGTH